MHSRRRRHGLAFALGVGAVLEACSLAIPFDEYPGSPHADASALTDVREAAAATDAGTVPDADAGGLTDPDAEAGAPATCEGIDLQTNADNCGACGRKCVTGACVLGRCPVEVVATGDAAVLSLALEVDVDKKTFLYFTTANGKVHRIALPGGTLEDALFDAGSAATGPLSLRNNAGSGIISIDGGVALFRAGTFGTEAPQPYVTNRSAVGPVSYQGQLFFWGEADGVGARTFGDAAVTVYAAPAPVVFTTAPSTQTTRLLWTTVDGAVYETSAVTPANPQRVIKPSGLEAKCLAATSDVIFLCQKSQGVYVYDWDQTAGNKVVLRPQRVPLNDPEALVVDAQNMYVIQYGAKATLYRAPVGGGDAFVLADKLAASPALFLQGPFVYFADGAKVVRTAR